MSDQRARTVDIPLRFDLAASTRPTVEDARRLFLSMLPALELAVQNATLAGGFPECGIFANTSRGALLTAKFGADIFVKNLRALVEGTAESGSVTSGGSIVLTGE